MSVQLDSRRRLPALVLLLGVVATGCSPGGSVSGPSGSPSSGGTGSPGGGVTGVEGTVYLTQDLSSAGIQVYAIWMEEEGPSSAGGGVEPGMVSVAVAPGTMPAGARVQAAQTDAGGKFIHPRRIAGGLTIRLGALPANCRRPADRSLTIEPGVLRRVQIDVLCYGPKGGPAPIE